MKEIKLGLIGLGAIGKVHADVLVKNQHSHGISLVSTADCDRSRRYPGVSFFSDHRQLLNNPNINAVSICTPPDTHYKLTIESLDSGKHVLVEKPPALTLDQLNEMAEKAQKSGLVLFTAFHANYSPEVLFARQVLKDKQVKSVSVIYKEDHTIDDPNKWLFNRQRAGGGALMDSGINAISVVRSVMPGPGNIDVLNVDLKMASDLKVETQATINFIYNQRVPGQLDIDWFYKGDEEHKINFETDQGQFTIDKTQGTLLKDGFSIFGNMNHKRTATNQHIEYRNVYQDFEKSLRNRNSHVSFQELKFVLDSYLKVGL